MVGKHKTLQHDENPLTPHSILTRTQTTSRLEVMRVLEVLHRVRQEVIAHAELFDPDAVERIDKAIASLQEVTLEVKAA